MKKLVFCLFITTLFSISATAQHELGVALGTSNLMGDFGGGPGRGTVFFKDVDSKAFRPSFGLFYRYNFLKVLALRGQLQYGRLVGNDDFSQEAERFERGLSSKSPVFDATAQLELNFIPLRLCSGVNRFSPYIAAGIGLTSINPTIEERDDNIDNLSNSSEFIVASGRNLALNIPISFGLKYKLKSNWVLGLEATYRMLFIDELDLYVRLRDDAYFFLTANVSYVFCKNGRGGGRGKAMGCPTF